MTKPTMVPVCKRSFSYDKFRSSFFIGKCLTLDYYPDRVESVKEQIESGYADWEQIVWVSTSHMVFPALHLNLKRTGLLPLLPLELVEYMVELTSDNRELNLRMIAQAHEITRLLNLHDISPVYLKGCWHMLDGLFRDIAERMMGDIDILVKDKDMVRAVEILMQAGYQSRTKMDPYLSLRQCYDLFLLSQRENPYQAIQKFGKFFLRMNTNIATASFILDSQESLPYK
ncbi:MAG: nucleotidyltransferase family protein [Bacteroidales bacterium]|nr:nucleotidyltransferase family protein [Bacteroidales bacterium]